MVVREIPYNVLAFGLSDIGLVRQNNEDVWAELPGLRFYVLADGMGGHQAGEVAAREAVTALCRIIQDTFAGQTEQIDIEDASAIIENSIEQVNFLVYRLGRSEVELRGMGTTLCCLFFHPKGLIYAHVGDSRIYQLRSGKLRQLTRDHSLLRELVDLGQINEQQAGDFLYKNIITKAIGTEASVEPSVHHLSEIINQDTYLMCSDGLSDLLSRAEIEDVLTQIPIPEDAAAELVSLAKEKGGHDNVTVVVIKVFENAESKNLPGQ
jgi:protein phosphatase